MSFVVDVDADVDVERLGGGAYWTINQLGAILPSTNACTWNPHHIPVPAPCCMLHGLTSLPPDDVCRGNYDVTGGETSANTLQAAHACHRCERLSVCVRRLHVINVENGKP
ncbi:GD24481 [Drosophila simulans]|uniref:GD24481 n=1 Tax=Drosophila simulans TaxID=7240 RepID=B4NUL6_DROSI|nr:GD24481 [Drosophila simulans]